MPRRNSKKQHQEGDCGCPVCCSRRDTVEGTSFDFDAFYRAYATQAKAFARRRTRSHDAEDFVQEAFLRAFQERTIETASSPQSYLHRIVANLIIDEHRKAQVRSRYSDDEADQFSVEDPGETEASVQSRLELQQICEALSILPPACRKAFSLHWIDGLNHGEISERLGVTVRTVDRYLKKVRKFLLESVG